MIFFKEIRVFPSPVRVVFISSFLLFCSAFAAFATGSPPFDNPTALAEPWSIATVDTGADFFGRSSAAVDGSGKVHVSYWDMTDYNLKYATNASGTWTRTTIDDVGNVGSDSSIALDGTGGVHISYRDAANQSVKYATNASGDWQIQTVAGGGRSNGHDTAIALDDAGNVHILFLRGSSFGSLRYVTNASGNWVVTEIFSTAEFDSPSMAVTGDGTVHVSYCDLWDLRLVHAVNSGAGWTHTAVVSNTSCTDTSLGLDGNGAVHISHYDLQKKDLNYSTNRSGSWRTLVRDSRGDVGAFSSLALDNRGKVHIAYHDSGNGDLKYTTNAGGRWKTSAPDTEGRVGRFCFIAKSISESVHISYYHDGSGDIRLASRRVPLFGDRFSDCTHQRGDRNWRELKGDFFCREQRNRKYASAPARTSWALVRKADLSAFTAGRIEAEVKLANSGLKAPNGAILFAYQDGLNYRYFKLLKRRIIIGQRGDFGGETGGIKGSAALRLGRRWHDVRIDLDPSGEVSVTLDDGAAPALSWTFPSQVEGRVGLFVKKAETLFDNFAVYGESVLP